jgi:hypothetical protein
MLMIPILVAFLFPGTAPDAKPAVVPDIHIQMSDTHQSIAATAPILLSMGPDPGGKTGATVNSDTTKTGQPTVDSATSSNSSSASNAPEGAERGSAQSQDTTNNSDSSKRGSSTSNSPSDSTDRSQSGPANSNPSATRR